jgi:hypothetical protein
MDQFDASPNWQITLCSVRPQVLQSHHQEVLFTLGQASRHQAMLTTKHDHMRQGFCWDVIQTLAESAMEAGGLHPTLSISKTKKNSVKQTES